MKGRENRRIPFFSGGLCSSLLNAFFLLATFHSALDAALPPLEPDDQWQNSDLVITGRVEEIVMKETVSGQSVNLEYSARLLVHSVEKGNGTMPGTVLEAHYWVAHRRPTGWTGDGGQRADIRVGETMRFFLKASREGAFRLLNPNGAEPILPDTKELNALMTEMLELARKGDSAAVFVLAEKLALPNDLHWFRNVFGPERGRVLSAEYRDYVPLLPIQMMTAMTIILREAGADSVPVAAFKVDDSTAIEFQRKFIMNMVKPVDLFTVRFGKRPLWSFAWSGGAFRFLGKLRSIEAPIPNEADEIPNDIVRQYLQVLSLGNPDELDRFFPSVEQLKAAVDCGETDSLPRDIIGYRREAANDLSEVQDSRIKLRFSRLLEEKSREEIEPGGMWDGRAVRAPIVLLKIRIEYQVRFPDDRISQQDDDVKLIRLGNRWFLRKPLHPDLAR